MDEQKQKAIQKHYATLVKSMNSLWIMDHLAHLLSLEEMESIRKAHLTPQERTRELIAVLFRKTEELRPFGCFIKALEETDDNHKILAEAILKTYTHENGANVAEKVSRNSHLDAGETEHGFKM
uniref:CARD domain-containing protein n=1 Tax=Plectus sambesii TaxID=2011161 RepID=A0A914UJD1_9BILA